MGMWGDGAFEEPGFFGKTGLNHPGRLLGFVVIGGCLVVAPNFLRHGDLLPALLSVGLALGLFVLIRLVGKRPARVDYRALGFILFQVGIASVIQAWRRHS